MSDTYTTQLTVQSEIQAAIPILHELRSHLKSNELATRLEQMRDEGYTLFGRFDDGELVAVAGVTVGTNFYLGRHTFIHDLVTSEPHRSEGHGEILLEHVHEWSREQGCETVELESGLWRDDAHRFYLETMDYEKYCYSFKYELDEEQTNG